MIGDTHTLYVCYLPSATPLALILYSVDVTEYFLLFVFMRPLFVGMDLFILPTIATSSGTLSRRAPAYLYARRIFVRVFTVPSGHSPPHGATYCSSPVLTPPDCSGPACLYMGVLLRVSLRAAWQHGWEQRRALFLIP